MDAVEVLLREGRINHKLTTTKKDQTAYQMAQELMRYDIAAEIEKSEYSKPSFGDTKQDNGIGDARRTPNIDVAKVFDEGRNRITNFFRLTANTASKNSRRDNENTTTATTEDRASSNDNSTNSTVREGEDNEPTSNSASNADNTKNFFTSTQDKLKNLLKPTSSPTPTASAVTDSNTEADSGLGGNDENPGAEESATLPETGDDNDVQNDEEQPPDSSESPSSITNDNDQTGQSKKSLFSKVGFFKKTKKNKSKDSNGSKDHKQTNEEDRQSDGDVDGNEEKDHECPVCLEIPLPPTHIYQCINGHLYCGDCMAMPNMFNCPQCGVDIGSVKMRNRYAEENIQRLYGKKKK